MSKVQQEFKKYDICIAKFDWSGDYKERPVLILTTKITRDKVSYIIHPFSSSDNNEDEKSVFVMSSGFNGLEQDSYLILNNKISISHTGIVKGPIGYLEGDYKDEIEQIQEKIRENLTK